MLNERIIEVRGFKWPLHPTGIARTRYLGADIHGHWLGIAKGSPWRSADGTQSGTFDSPFVKLVPEGTFWTACFNLADPVVDVDIVLPVHWAGDILEEVDLELDILRSASGQVTVRDQDEFARVRDTLGLPNDLAAQAEATCAYIRTLVEASAEPFGTVGHAWLTRFLTEPGEA